MLEIPDHEWNAVLDDVIAELLAASGVEAPPVDATCVAGALGIRIAWDDQQGGRARIVRLQGDRSILLRRDPRPERLQWAVAHEIGEACTCQVFLALDADPRAAPAGTRESVANHLAGRLLAPTPWLAEHARECDWDLADLKTRFSTASHELLVRRMLDPAVDGPPVVVTIFDNDRLTFRRGSHALGGRATPLSPAERRCQKQMHATGRPTCARVGQGRLRGWPVHEVDWKREILRLETPEIEG